MTLNDVAYMVLESIRHHHIVDDERIDLRLIKDWVKLKRAQYIKNSVSTNPNTRLNLNLYQKIDVTLEVVDVIDAGDYPYSVTGIQDDKIVQSVNTIPSIIEGKSGPLIYTIESEDLMKYPYSIVDYDYLRFAGNGKFNKNLIFAAIRDNRIYLKYNANFDTYDTVVIRAIFEDPTEVTGYQEDSTPFPANLGLIEYIKNAIFEIDFNMTRAAKSDEVNNASGDIK